MHGETIKTQIKNSLWTATRSDNEKRHDTCQNM